jgi:hypothetical protein
MKTIQGLRSLVEDQYGRADIAALSDCDRDDGEMNI